MMSVDDHGPDAAETRSGTRTEVVDVLLVRARDRDTLKSRSPRYKHQQSRIREVPT